MSAVLEVQEPGARYVAHAAPLLVQQFDLLATAPGGVDRLRELILTLAVQGQLVAQDPRDEPAALLIERAREERDRLLRTGEIRRGAIVAPTSKGPDNFPLPAGWAWTCVGEVGQVVGGGTPKSDVPEYWADGGVPWLTPADLYGHNELIICRGRRDISPEGLSASSARLLPTGAVLFSSRAPIGYVAIAGAPLATNQGFKSCVPYVDGLSAYLYWQLKLLAPRIDAAASGTTFKEISGADFALVEFALPPLAEQARIVARVDELMRLCDALEAKGRLEEEQHARLLGTLLGTLTDSTTSEELAANWQRVADHFDLLLDRPEAVDALEQVILQLGLRGVLLPSPSLDGFPTADGQQRSLQDELFAWPTAKLGDVLTDLRYGTSAKCSYAQSGTPVLRIPNLHDGAIDISDLKFGDLEPKEADNLRLEVGDLLIIRSNGSAGLVGTAALVSSPLPGFAFAGYLVRARLDRAKVMPHFMALVMKSPEVRRQIEGPIRTTSGVKNINSTEIQRISFMLPPLEVQDLIVHTVTELRRLCANLHDRLDRCNAVQAALADALIDQALVA